MTPPKLTIEEISAEEAAKIRKEYGIPPIEKQRKEYTEEEKAEAYYRFHICGAE